MNLKSRLKFILSAVLLLILLIGTGSLHSNFPSVDQAAVTAAGSTPLRTVTSSHITPPGPRVLALIGEDSNQRKLAVFVNPKGNIEGYEYLDKGISREMALEIAHAIHPFTGEPIIELGWTGNKPYWYIQTGEKEVFQLSLDFYSGKELGK